MMLPLSLFLSLALSHHLFPSDSLPHARLPLAPLHLLWFEDHTSCFTCFRPPTPVPPCCRSHTLSTRRSLFLCSLFSCFQLFTLYSLTMLFIFLLFIIYLDFSSLSFPSSPPFSISLSLLFFLYLQNYISFPIRISFLSFQSPSSPLLS